MKTFAVLSGNVVSNVIVAESLEIAKSVEPTSIEINDSVLIGFIYDPKTETFKSPDTE